MNSKTLILGNGYIGQRLQEALNCPVSGGRITTFEDAQKVIGQYNPAIIINCIGHTGERNVDDCERAIDKTLLSNTFIPIILAEIARRKNIKLVHISSGCIYHYDYDHQSPLREEEEPDFFGLFYSRTKIYAEKALTPLYKGVNILTLRVRIPLDNRPHPKNILNKLIAYGKVIDIPNSVTYIPDFIEAVQHLLNIDARGLYNVVARGGLRYPELMEVYKKYVPEFSYERLDLKDLNLVRSNLLLSTEKLEKTGFQVRKVNDILEECVTGYVGSAIKVRC